MSKKKSEEGRVKSEGGTASPEVVDPTTVDAVDAVDAGEVLEVITGTEAAIAADACLGDQAKNYVPVYLKRKWGRAELPFEVGDCIGYAVLPDGVDLNLFVDAVRNDFAGDKA